jgi:hypothetical protein
MQWKALWHSSRRKSQNGNNHACLDSNSNRMLKTMFFPKTSLAAKIRKMNSLQLRHLGQTLGKKKDQRYG